MVLDGSPVVDIHTHIYPPAYIDLLSFRTEVPYIHRPATPYEDATASHPPDPRLVILPSDDAASISKDHRGRPVDASYSDIRQKLAFMDAHHIDASVISLANPWLDWLPNESAAETAQQINDSVERLCSEYPGRLFHFATLPLSALIPKIVAEVKRLSRLRHCKGLIMGSTGLGQGLDDEQLAPIWSAIEESGMLVFIHPHYGLPSEVFGPRQQESGHVLPLALGFPLETTIAFVRMYVAGAFERHPKLKLLLAHSGGTVPFLAGRLHSCMLHERVFRDDEGVMKPRKTIWEVLAANVWLDSVVYADVGVTAASAVVGADRVLFGTDHPFFPPIGKEEADSTWASVDMNVEAVEKAYGHDSEGARGVLGENAVRLLGLDLATAHGER
jgi:aminocarboxymuconate-semialdehyde decarboxylase